MPEALAMSVAALLVGMGLGWMAATIRQRSAVGDLRATLAESNARLDARAADIARLERRVEELGSADVRCAALSAQLDAERKVAVEKAAAIQDAENNLREAFQALGAEALRQNSESFLQLARTSLSQMQQASVSDMDRRQQAIGEMVSPIRETLEKMGGTLRAVEIARVGSYESLMEQVRAMGDTQRELNGRTRHLVEALRAPTVRGRWGEIQLKRVCEMAGMLDHCDFTEQTTVHTEDGRLRPDLTVRLPGGKVIIVDAKAPLQAYLEAMDATDETVREARLRDHARQVREHITKLSAKSYWGQFEATPELVVMFLPGETFFSAALQYDPSLIEYGVDSKVIPASPTTLIALLRSVAYGWRQERVARNAEEISALGRELYDRIRVFAAHFDDLRKSLERSVASYNSAVGSLERKVLPQVRKFRELGATSAAELSVADGIDTALRTLDTADMPPDAASQILLPTTPALAPS